jgi:hypothetical protein
MSDTITVESAAGTTEEVFVDSLLGSGRAFGTYWPSPMTVPAQLFGSFNIAREPEKFGRIYLSGVVSYASSVETPAMYVDRVLEPYVSSNDSELRIDIAVGIRVHQLVVDLTEPTSVPPTVTPNGSGGAVLYWRADERVIEIELDSDGSHYARVRDSRGEATLEDEGMGDFPTSTVKKAVVELTAVVQLLNPRWREVFA